LHPYHITHTHTHTHTQNENILCYSIDYLMVQCRTICFTEDLCTPKQWNETKLTAIQNESADCFFCMYTPRCCFKNLNLSSWPLCLGVSEKRFVIRMELQRQFCWSNQRHRPSVFCVFRANNFIYCISNRGPFFFSFSQCLNTLFFFLYCLKWKRLFESIYLISKLFYCIEFVEQLVVFWIYDSTSCYSWRWLTGTWLILQLTMREWIWAWDFRIT
jgi:hypothetical protein